MSSIDPNNQEQVNQAAPVLDDRLAVVANAVVRIISQLRIMKEAGRLHPDDYVAFEGILDDIDFHTIEPSMELQSQMI